MGDTVRWGKGVFQVKEGRVFAIGLDWREEDGIGLDWDGNGKGYGNVKEDHLGGWKNG